MTRQEEVDRNYEAFLKALPTIGAENHNKFALMKDQQILGFYADSGDARVAADTFISDGLYSIQSVNNNAIDLGYFTYAIPVDQL